MSRFLNLLGITSVFAVCVAGMYYLDGLACFGVFLLTGHALDVVERSARPTECPCCEETETETDSKP